MGDSNPIEITVNGRRHSLDVGSPTSLLDLLRDTLRLYGPKECCGVGECGACTVSVDGRTVNSCLMLAVEADEAEVVTIEGLGAEELDPLQQAFIDHGAVQCGFCIPGMIMSARALLNQDLQADDEKIREALSGNLCRCGGYNRIVEAVRAVAITSRTRQGRSRGELCSRRCGSWSAPAGPCTRAPRTKPRNLHRRQCAAFWRPRTREWNPTVPR